MLPGYSARARSRLKAIRCWLPRRSTDRSTPADSEAHRSGKQQAEAPRQAQARRGGMKFGLQASSVSIPWQPLCRIRLREVTGKGSGLAALARDQALALRALAGKLASAADAFGLLARFLLGWL